MVVDPNDERWHRPGDIVSFVNVFFQTERRYVKQRPSWTDVDLAELSTHAALLVLGLVDDKSVPGTAGEDPWLAVLTTAGVGYVRRQWVGPVIKHQL